MKVTLIAAISADGRIGESGDQISTDWTSEEDLAFFRGKTRESGVMLMGRTTFDTLGRDSIPGKLIIVTTRDPEAHAHRSVENLVEFTSASPQEIVADLKRRGFTQLVLAGGQQNYDRFLEAGLVDDVYLTIEPLFFGAGVPLLNKPGRVKLNLQDVSRLGDQAVLLYYSVNK